MDANDELIIREEQPRDFEAISRLTQQAFANSAHGDNKEYLIIDTLRSTGKLSQALVASVSARVVGFAATSPVQISDGAENWHGLGPLAVLPEFQDMGIGSMLVDEILNRLRISGAAGCVVLGDPGFYCRFGFEPNPELGFANFDPEYFQSIRFNAKQARGEVSYQPAFYNQA